jgi:GrpB-like predicted nucleotidyltransferase (UPF0157 family)
LNVTVGLARGRVLLVSHCAEWRAQFAAEQHRLHDVLGDLVQEIEHVGSTAVEHLCAKPIIDIAIAVPDSATVPEIGARLRALEYEFEMNAGSNGGHIFVKEISPEIATHHIHIVEHDDSQWRNYLRFRDLLRQDSVLREAYSDLKQLLAERYADDRKTYSASKTTFIVEALALGATRMGYE